MKRRNFTLSVTENIDEVQKAVEQCPLWAWIIHDEDTKDGSPVPIHLHAYIEFPNPRSFASVAEILGIPENMILKVIDKRGILQYFTHKNQPEKHLYNFEEIVSNFDVKRFYDNLDDTLFSDYHKLRTGVMTPSEFYEIHKADINASGFYPRLRILDLVFTASARSTGERAPRIDPNTGELRP